MNQRLEGQSGEGKYARKQTTLWRSDRATARARDDRHKLGRDRMNKYDAHCAIAGCTCTHDYCYKGWIDNPTGTTTAPCPYCRQSLDERLHRAHQAKGKGYPQEAVQRILATVKR